MLLLLAGCDRRRSENAGRIHDLTSTADHDLLLAELRARRLLSLLGGRLVELAPDALPASFASAVSAHRLRSRAVGLAALAELHEVLALLGAAGIPARALKGAALAEAAHGDVGARESSDLDVLVAREHLREATTLLVAGGFTPPRDRLGPDGFPALHLRLDHPERRTVELHWRVSWHEEAFSRRLLESGDEADEAAALLLFYARDGFYGLRLAADLAAFADRGGTAPLDELAQRYPELRRTWETATFVADRTVGVPQSAWWERPPRLDRRARLAARLSNWSQTGDRDQLAANMTLVDALLAPPGSTRAFARRVVQAVPREQAPGHVAKTAVRAGAALARVRRGWWAPVPSSLAA